MEIVKKLRLWLTNFLQKNVLKNYLIRLIHYTWVPICLSLLFVLQNLAFNNWLGISPGQYFIRRGLVTFALGTVIFGSALFFRKNARHIYLFFACGFVSLIFISEFIYYQYAGAFLQASAIRYIDSAATQTKTIFGLLSFGLLFFLLNFIFWGIDIYFFNRLKDKHSKLNLKEKFLALIIIAVFVCVGYGHLIRVEAKEWGHTEFLYNKIFDYDNYVSKVGVVNYFLQDASKYILKKNKVTEEDKEFLMQWLKKQSLKNSENRYFGAAKGKNLIMIQIESLDDVLINKKIIGQEITPNLNRLAKDGVYFSNYFAQFALGTTADAEFSILNSLYPLPNDVAFERFAQNNYSALPKILAENNYQTFSLHGDVISFWNRANIYPNLGFNDWFEKKDYVSKNPLGGAFELSDQDFFEQSVEKLEKLSQPFAAILMTLSLHTPFTIPNDQKKLSLAQENNLNQSQKDYLQAAFYVDKVLGEFIESLKQKGLYENSLILIYGDHGSYSEIEKIIEEKNIIQEAFGNSRVPLIILNSGLEAEKINETPASHLDLYPTIINLLGIDPKIKFFGQDIFNTQEPAVVKRKNISGSISAIFTDTILFVASSDGIFEKSSCYAWPEKSLQSIENCQEIYRAQTEKIKASDIIIKANLINRLAEKKS